MKSVCKSMWVWIAGVVLMSAGWAEASTGTVEIIAHRGFSAEYRDNSLAAITNGWRVGADWVEVDLRQLKDGSIVLFHDAHVADIEVDTLTHKRLEQLAGHKVLRFEDALALADDQHRYLLDMKDRGSAFVQRLVADIVDLGVGLDALMFQSGSGADLKQVRETFPDATCHLVHALRQHSLFRMRPTAGSLSRLMEREEVDGISAKGRDVMDERYVKRLKEEGHRVYIWTINPRDRMEHYIGLGVDGIITDHPDRLKAVLSEF